MISRTRPTDPSRIASAFAGADSEVAPLYPRAGDNEWLGASGRLPERGRLSHLRSPLPRVTDRQFRLAVLNLLEDAAEARRKQDREAQERQRAEVQVRASEERYRSLFMQMDQGFGVAMVRCDERSRSTGLQWLESNPRFEALSGLPTDVLFARHSSRDARDDTEPFWLDACGQVALTGDPMRIERRFTTPDRWLDIHMFRLGSADQRHIAVLLTDITERMRQAARVALIADVTAEMASLSTEAEIESVVSEHLRGYFAVDRAEIVSLDLEPFESPSIQYLSILGPTPRSMPPEPLGEPIRQALRSGDVLVFGDHAPADGENSAQAFVMVPMGRIGARLRGLILCDHAARVWRADEIETVKEVAGRLALRLETLEADAAWRKNEQYLRFILDNARDYAIISLDLDRRVMSWNSGAAAILGYTSEEAVGRIADFIFTSEDRAAEAAAYEARTATLEGRAINERWHVRKDGTRIWGSGVMTVMRDRKGEPLGLLKIFRDQTDELAAKEELEQSRKRLLEALEQTEAARAEAEAAGQAKDRFLAMLSHELRTPLTPVLLMSELLAVREGMPPEVQEALVIIRRNVDLEVRLVDDLLDMTRITRGLLKLARTPLDLHEVIRKGVDVSRSDVTSKNQQLSVELEAHSYDVDGDAARLQQVVWNLLKNASKFTPRGGSIVLRTANPDSHCVSMEVTDTGIGVDTEVMPYIFEAFRQADASITRRFGGLGLGLAIVRAIVLSHGGDVSVASEGADRGATFTVTLPLSNCAPVDMP